MSSELAQDLTPLIHLAIAGVALLLWRRSNAVQQQVAGMFFVFALVGLVYWLALHLIPSDMVPGHVLSRWRAFFQALVVLAFGIGLL